MRKLLLLLFLSSASFAEQLIVTERLFCPVTTFELYQEQIPIGIAAKQILAYGTNYDFYDTEETHIGSASTRYFSWATTVDLTDSANQLLGSIEENPWKFTFGPEYKIRNEHDKTVLAVELDHSGSRLTVYSSDNSSHKIATIHRAYIRFHRDEWVIDILDKDYLKKVSDPKLLILLAIIHTDKDNKSRFWSD